VEGGTGTKQALQKVKAALIDILDEEIFSISGTSKK
jgi:hypothetical protein